VKIVTRKTRTSDCAYKVSWRQKLIGSGWW